MIRYHLIGTEIQCKHTGKIQQFILDPLASMLKTSTGVRTLTTEKGAAHAARGTMIVRRGLHRDLAMARFWHRSIP